MSDKYCTVKDIAEASGVSLSTVSYALRNNPRIPVDTRLRIQKVAERLGYRRNPHISALMSVIGRGRKVRNVENIALIWPQGTRSDIQTVRFCCDITRGVENRARALNLGVEKFWMQEDSLSGSRMTTILTTRYIRGLLFAPALQGSSLSLGLEWDRFVTVVLGHAQWTPEMHRCLSNQYNAVRVCLEQLALSGAKRTAAILSGDINRRTDYAQEAAFLTHHSQPANARKLIFFVSAGALTGIFPWLKTNKVDSVIFGSNQIYNSCLAMNKSALLKLRSVTLDWTPDNKHVPGIKFRHDLIAESAVDLLVSQLYMNEVGVPERARRLSLRGDWMPGLL